MNKKAKFLFFCMIIVAGRSFSQKIAITNKIVFPKAVAEKKYSTLSTKGDTTSHLSCYSSSKFQKYYKAIVLKDTMSGINRLPADFPVSLTSPSYSIPSNFYTQSFGFFCKKELQLEKATKIPFKFRLGSVQQCDWLEGKPNAGIR